MALKIRVISDHYKALGKRSSALFGVSGGRIGRSNSNDWILPDPDRYISSHHCAVQFKAGAWILEDTSTNGVFVNGSNTPVSVDGPYALRDGDRLRLGDYELLVSIDDRNDFPAEATGQLPVPVRAPKAKPMTFGDDLGEELDITDLLSDPSFESPPVPQAKRPAPPPPAPAPAQTSREQHISDLEKELGIELGASTRFQNPPPAKVPLAKQGGFSSLLGSTGDTGERAVPPTLQPANKADDWQMQTRPYDRKTMTVLPTGAVVNRANESEKPKRSDNGGSADLQAGVDAFCRGAGIDPSSLPSDTQAALLTLAGQTMREVVLGLMDALKSRNDLKNRFRLTSANTLPGENNPIKTASSVDDAVRRLLDAHAGRYLGPVDAVRSAFAELKTHQNSMASAVQSAVDELMSRIEPGDLQERFDRGLKRSPLLGAANKLKYWDLYVEFYQVVNQRNEQGLPPLFAEELARAYAEELDSGKAKRKKNAQ
jgi:type VI secretion system FHA domain protein